MNVQKHLRNPRAVIAFVAIASVAAAVTFTVARGRQPSSLRAADRSANANPPDTNAAPGRPVETTGAPFARSADAATKTAAADAASDGDHVGALRRGLASDDEATRIAAVEAAVSTTAIETLDDLEHFDLKKDPETAPTVIHAIALLGASAEGPKRERAAGTLSTWLRDEMKREGPDVAGNVSNIVEALGNVGGSTAIDALGAALDKGDLALHVQTLAVMKLGELGDSRARGPVERFAKRVAALPPLEGIDEELRVEAIEEARTTLSKI